MIGTALNALVTLGKALEPLLKEIVNSLKTTNNNDDFFRGVLLVEQLLQTEFMVNGSVDLKEKMTCTQSLAEVFADAYYYMLKNKSQQEIKFDQQTMEHFDKILSRCEQLCKQMKENKPGGSRGNEKDNDLPGGNVRRCLLYLSLFPEGYVFNRNRTARLFAVRESTPENRNGDLHFAVRESTPENQIGHLLEEVDQRIELVNKWGEVPCHFRKCNDVKKKCKMTTWPERRSFHLREAFCPEMGNDAKKESIPLFSLTFLGPSNKKLKLEEKKFLLLTVLTLRYVTLEDDNNLEKLSLLRYLDLKHSTLKGCGWLEGLEELQLLDLRYTTLETIPVKYLNKLVRLEHLLLGYIARTGAVGLAGAKLKTENSKIEKLNTQNLKTLRSITDTENLKTLDIIENNKSVSKITDLSVTGLNSRKLNQFWSVIQNFKNLTSLGVAVTNTSAIKLQECPEVLKKQLKRLRIKGQIEMLPDFDNLIDLTLVWGKMIDRRTTIPNKLLCLRLYGMSKETTLEFDNRFENLKKLVIGDMEKLETVQVSSAVIESVNTLKLCNLPEFEELIKWEYSKGRKDRKETVLRRERESEQKGDTQLPLATIQSQTHIFLKKVCKRNSSSDKISFQRCPKHLNVYEYDMNKQCYEEV